MISYFYLISEIIPRCSVNFKSLALRSKHLPRFMIFMPCWRKNHDARALCNVHRDAMRTAETMCKAWRWYPTVMGFPRGLVPLGLRQLRHSYIYIRLLNELIFKDICIYLPRTLCVDFVFEKSRRSYLLLVNGLYTSFGDLMLMLMLFLSAPAFAPPSTWWIIPGIVSRL